MYRRDGFTLLDWGGVRAFLASVPNRPARRERGALALHMIFIISLGHHDDFARTRGVSIYQVRSRPFLPSVALLRIGVEIGSTGLKKAARPGFGSGRRRTRDWQQQCLSLFMCMSFIGVTRGYVCVRELCAVRACMCV